MSGTSLLTLYTETATDRHMLRLRDAESPDDFLRAMASIAEDDGSRLPVEWTYGAELPELRSDRSGTGLIAGTEAQNAVHIYEYLGPMTPVEASDRRLWTYLSTVTFLDYTSKRWPLEGVSGASWKNRVLDRWIMPRSGRTELIRNSISRLWWVANLTHDQECGRPLSKDANDPFAYTRVALEKEDRFLAIFDRDSGMVPELRFALLEHFLKNENYTKEAYVRDFMKEVILISGYRELAGLSAEQVREVLDSVSERLDDTPVTVASE